MKKYIAGILSGILLMTGTVVFAETKQTIEAFFGRIKLVVDGVPIDKETLLYNGTTYVPLKVAAEALGKEVSYDENTQTAYIGSAKQQQPAQVTGNYSRTNPAPLNIIQQITVKTYTKDFTASVRVVETVRGNAAWEMIKVANMFNDEPETGYEYILAKIAVSAISVADDKALSLGSYDFDCYSSSNVAYDRPFVVAPLPELADKLYAGGNTMGYVVFQVKIDDAAPKIVYEQNYDGSGGIWFSLQ